MADNPLGQPGGAAGADATLTETPSTVDTSANSNNTAVTVPTIDLTANDAAMVKLFERLGTLKGATFFFVVDQGIDSFASIHDLHDDAIESLCKLSRKPKPGHPVALRVETQFQLCNFHTSNSKP